MRLPRVTLVILFAIVAAIVGGIGVRSAAAAGVADVVSIMPQEAGPALAGRAAGRAAASVVPAGLRRMAAAVQQQLVEGTRVVAPALANRVERLFQPDAATAAAPASAAQRTGGALLRVSGTALIGVVLALIVLVTALGPLEGVIKTVEADVSGAFWRGALTQAIALPILAAGLFVLAVTVIGLLAVPIALFVSLLAVAGVCTLGVLAVAAVIGRARATDDKGRSRAGLLRALLLGYAVLWTPWVLAAVLISVPGIGLAARVVALASLWVVTTVGIGAVVRSRGGLRIPDAVGPARAAVGAPAPDWSTPTPIGGVAAARLPTTTSAASRD